MRDGFRSRSIANWGAGRKIPETKPQMVRISISQSLLTTDANIFKGYLFPKRLFPAYTKENIFKNSWKSFKRNPMTSPIKEFIQSKWQPLPGAGHKTAKLCCTLRLEGNWQAYCQMEYHTFDQNVS